MLTEFIIIVLVAFLCEWIDSAIGMGYGTILSPLLLSIGLPATLVVPSVLITQALGGSSAALFHHKCGNVNLSIKPKDSAHIANKIEEPGFLNSLKRRMSEDLKVVAVITSLGMITAVLAAVLALSVPKVMLNTYIGLLVLVMGLLILIGFSFKYSIKKMFLVGIISAFNKSMSGGGYGPVVTGGQMVLGQEQKRSIGCTTAAEPLICIAGFVTFLLLKGISTWWLIAALGLGSLIAGPIGAMTTKKVNRKALKTLVAVLLLILGALTLLTTYNIIGLKISI